MQAVYSLRSLPSKPTGMSELEPSLHRRNWMYRGPIIWAGLPRWLTPSTHLEYLQALTWQLRHRIFLE